MSNYTVNNASNLPVKPFDTSKQELAQKSPSGFSENISFEKAEYAVTRVVNEITPFPKLPKELKPMSDEELNILIGSVSLGPSKILNFLASTAALEYMAMASILLYPFGGGLEVWSRYNRHTENMDTYKKRQKGNWDAYNNNIERYFSGSNVVKDKDSLPYTDLPITVDTTFLDDIPVSKYNEYNSNDYNSNDYPGSLKRYSTYTLSGKSSNPNFSLKKSPIPDDIPEEYVNESAFNKRDYSTFSGLIRQKTALEVTKAYLPNDSNKLIKTSPGLHYLELNYYPRGPQQQATLFDPDHFGLDYFALDILNAQNVSVLVPLRSVLSSYEDKDGVEKITDDAENNLTSLDRGDYEVANIVEALTAARNTPRGVEANNFGLVPTHIVNKETGEQVNTNKKLRHALHYGEGIQVLLINYSRENNNFL